jgi:two-component system, NtrC family, nitrogen regulation response regulator GlnG
LGDRNQTESSQPRRDSSISILLIGASVKVCVPLLSRRGLSATLCPDAKSAIKMLSAARYQIALCYIDAPWERWTRFLNLVRQEFPEVAVVVVTKPRDLRRGVQAMVSGASGYVQTPIEPKTLVTVLQSALKRKRLEAALLGLPYRRLQSLGSILAA